METGKFKKEDRRVRYTKKAIREGFLRLLEQKPIEKISVTEICREADINRGTFYAHYSDPYELRRCMVKELTDAMEERVRDYGVKRLTTEESLELLKEHRELCQVFAGPNGDQDSMLRIVSKHADDYLDLLTRQTGEMTEKMRECLKMLLVSSISTVFKYWLDNDMAADPAFVAEVIDTYCTQGVNGFMKE